MRYLFLHTIFLVLGIQALIAQYTLVPDSNFEQALIDLGIDSEGTLDGQFLTTDAIGRTLLDIDNRNINDLTGIEAFVDLEWLDAFNNNITEFDTSQISSTTMWTIRISNNNLSSIDLSYIPEIVNLSLGGNNFTSLEVTNLPSLFGLGVSDQEITSLNISNCPNLQVLEFANSSISTIDLSDLPSLRILDCQESQIESLDFTHNQNLEEVIAYITPLSSIHLPNNPNLELLSLDLTPLTLLDVSNCTNLETLLADSCLLTQVDLNPNLLVADLDNNQLSAIDLSSVITPLAISLQNNLFNGVFTPSSTGVVTMILNDNLIDELDFSNTPNLDRVHFDNNPVTAVNFNGAHALRYVNSQETLLSEVDFSNNPNLESMFFYDNPELQLVNLKNGNNANIEGFYGTSGTPKLSCVVVDDPTAPNANIQVLPEVALVESEKECVLGNTQFLATNLNLYPNPVKDYLYIETLLSIEKVAIYTILGNKLLEIEDHPETINLTNLPQGVLFVKIETNRGIITKKIVKI